MTTNPRRCPICKSETAAARLTSLSGEDAPLAVTVKGMPMLECTQGHRLFPLADFPLLLLDHLLEQDEPKLPVSQSKGWSSSTTAVRRAAPNSAQATIGRIPFMSTWNCPSYRLSEST